MIKREIKIFLASLVFFTRIPCPVYNDNFAEYASKASKYLPLVGWIVGGFGAVVYLLARYILPYPIAVLLSIISTIAITGAFHEDGFADFLDGFGGGSGKEKILEIMKDSATGVYGVIGIVLLLMMKFLCLTEINPASFFLILIAGHSISRFNSVSFMYTHNYLRENNESAKCDLTSKKTSLSELLPAAFFGILPVLFLGYAYLFALIPIFITRQIFSYYFTKKLDGYTGDCLGAVQQITEIVFYISILVKF